MSLDVGTYFQKQILNAYHISSNSSVGLNTNYSLQKIKSNLLSVVKMVVFHLWIAVYFQVPLLDFDPQPTHLLLNFLSLP